LKALSTSFSKGSTHVTTPREEAHKLVSNVPKKGMAKTFLKRIH
jgi:hypothetical protein